MDPLTIVAAGISAIGSLFKGITSLFGGNNEEKAAEYAAQQHQDEAGVSAQEALDEGARAAAHAAVQGAANGGGFVGSTLGVIQDLSNRAMFNARAALYRGKAQAQSDIYQGKVAQAQGQQALIGGVLGAGSSLIGGFAKSASDSAQLKAFSQGLGDADASAGASAGAGAW